MIAGIQPSGYIYTELEENFQDTGVLLGIQEVEFFYPKGEWMLSSPSLPVWPLTSKVQQEAKLWGTCYPCMLTKQEVEILQQLSPAGCLLEVLQCSLCIWR